MYRFRVVVIAKENQREYPFSINATCMEDAEEKIMRMANGNWTIKSISRAEVA